MKNKLQHILRTAAAVLGACGILVLLGFVGSIRSGAVCEAFDVAFAPGSGDFVTEEAVREVTAGEGKMPVGLPLGEIDTRRIEQAVLALPYVKSAAVYKTIDRRLIAEVAEREPAVRLIDAEGRHAVIDTDGYLLPVPEHRRARLPVISGAFRIDPAAVEHRLHAADEGKDPRLADCLAYAEMLRSDPLWYAQLQHTEVDAEGEFTAFPQVGNHTIVFGKAERLEEKFDALAVFYRKGMDAARWNKYSTVNLKFKDQIVCTKK